LLKNILLSNIDIDSSHKDYRKLLIANLGYIISFTVFIVFSFSNLFFRSNNIAGFLELTFTIPALYGFFKLRSDKDIDSASMFVSYMLFAAILIVLFLFQFKECIVAWALLFPFIAMNLCGVEKGLRFIIIFNLIVYVSAYYFWSDHHVSLISYIRFVTVSMIITFLVYFYEKIILNSFEKQTQLNASLIKRVKEARELAITDSLTNLYNQRHFDLIYNEEFNRAKRAGEPLIFAIIDIDNFKLYNDTYGHDMGNSALEIVGKVLKQQTVRSGDYAFRIGGEEFALILQSSNSENIDNHLNDLRIKIEQENIEHKNNKPYNVLTISVGAVNVVNYDTVTIKEAYRKADKNLYAMKKSGRNAVLVSKI
jgi:diguanylate cyclase (GGDEF)-like protein